MDAPLIPEASLRLDRLDCSSLPGTDKRAIKINLSKRYDNCKVQ